MVGQSALDRLILVRIQARQQARAPLGDRDLSNSLMGLAKRLIFYQNSRTVLRLGNYHIFCQKNHWKVKLELQISFSVGTWIRTI